MQYNFTVFFLLKYTEGVKLNTLVHVSTKYMCNVTLTCCNCLTLSSFVF